MPSPIGHALGGLAAGWLTERRPSSGEWRSTATLAVVALLPDVDLLWGAHHQATHSLAAVAFVWVVARAAVLLAPGLRPPASDPWPLTAAYASHILLDLLGADSTPPIGLMLFWPFSHEHVIAPWTPFPAISRRHWLPGFWAHNALAVLFEVMVLAPIAAAGWWVRARGTRKSPYRSSGPGDPRRPSA
ncbi:MAG: metal-dependent hydrolase [Vicinamibacterales bacterium]